MILYGMGVLQLIQALQHHVLYLECHRRHDTLKFLFADDSAIAWTLSRTKAQFVELWWLGIPLGYHTDPDKRFVVTSSEDVAIATYLFQDYCIKITK